MSDKIEVGDRVRISVYGGFHDATVLALDADWAWVLQDHDRRGYTSVPLAKVTRIEPEPVTLTPKFKLGEKICPRDGYPQTILAVSVSYRLAPNGTWWGEEEVDLVPTPCPTCKGSGKSSE